MSVTITSLTRIDARTVRVTWSSTLGGAATFYVWLDGRLIDATRSLSRLFTLPADRSPVIEVFDSASDTPSVNTSAWGGVEGAGRVRLAWYVAPGANTGGSYRVEEYVGGSWVTRETVKDTDAGYYAWTSRVLADGETHQFRVRSIAAGSSGANVGSPVSVSVLMVRVPDVPAVAMTYDEDTGDLTIAAA